MREIQVTVTDGQGLHARPAGRLVQLVRGMDSAVTLIAESGKSAPASRLIAVMSLGIRAGEQITLRVEGEHEERDAAALEEFFAQHS